MTEDPPALRRAWTAFRTPARLVALAVAVLTVVAVALGTAYLNRSSCSAGNMPTACPTDPVGPGGRTVDDHFYFAHRTLTGDGSLTVRLAGMTGVITYPPPHHDTIVAGLVPWAKVGIIVKDGLRPGSSYAALMRTGRHGVRLQYDYVHDIAGSPRTAAPRWLRLTRTGGTVVGEESADGRRWRRVGVVRPKHLGARVDIGLFAASPGDLTLRRVGLGGSLEQVRFTQVTGTFDHVSLTGATSAHWAAGPIGEMGQTDWERYHRAPGLVARGGTLAVTGTGDIGPIGEQHAASVGDTLGGLPLALLLVLIVAARFGAGRGGRRRPAGDGEPGAGGRRYRLARLGVLVVATGVAGLVAAAIAVPAGVAALRAAGSAVIAVPLGTELRVVVGAAALLAAGAAFGYGLGTWCRRGWLGALVGTVTLLLPYAVGRVPLLPDAVADWLLRLSPAAGFAVLSSNTRFDQVTAHFAPSAGYLPLPWWGGLAVVCGYAAIACWLALRPRTAGRPAANDPVSRTGPGSESGSAT
ncbi:hypothetical protein GCM10009635_07090 [Actinocatenispora thailandica]